MYSITKSSMHCRDSMGQWFYCGANVEFGIHWCCRLIKSDFLGRWFSYKLKSFTENVRFDVDLGRYEVALPCKDEESKAKLKNNEKLVR